MADKKDGWMMMMMMKEKDGEDGKTTRRRWRRWYSCAHTHTHTRSESARVREESKKKLQRGAFITAYGKISKKTKLNIISLKFFSVFVFCILRLHCFFFFILLFLPGALKTKRITQPIECESKKKLWKLYLARRLVRERLSLSLAGISQRRLN